MTRGAGLELGNLLRRLLMVLELAAGLHPLIRRDLGPEAMTEQKDHKFGPPRSQTLDTLPSAGPQPGESGRDAGRHAFSWVVEAGSGSADQGGLFSRPCNSLCTALISA